MIKSISKRVYYFILIASMWALVALVFAAALWPLAVIISWVANGGSHV